uniref:Uncharacterized protein n=1 Tax=Tanacetum cinerariifolium TaxID=118510 RepID=A0A6L2J6C6_TANCI|nr:hypothetical protein [Tanacetum cinerariifolium]
MDEEDSRALKRLNESQEDKAAKKQKLDEEVEELKRHLQTVPNDEDDVYTEATPFARKVPVVDYEIYNENNKPYYKIKRADERRYPLTRFTLDQMLNVRLEVEEESEVSLELLRCVLTHEALDAFCNTFHIPEEVHSILTNQDDTMHERPTGKIRLAMSSDNAQSTVTYTSISSDSDGPSWVIPLMNAIHVLKPEHPEYHAPSDDDIQVEDDDEDPGEDPSEEQEPEDDDEDPEKDLNEEHKPEDKDTKEPFEGFDETEPFEDDKTAVTLPKHRGARISIKPQTPLAASTQALIEAFAVGSSPSLLPPANPAYDQTSLGHRAAMIHMRDDIPKEDMQPRIRFVLIAPPPGCDVTESSAAARAPRMRGQRTAYETEPREVHQAYLSFKAWNRALLAQLETLKTHMSHIEWQRQSSEDLAVTQMMRIHALEAKTWTDTVGTLAVAVSCTFHS